MSFRNTGGQMKSSFTKLMFTGEDTAQRAEKLAWVVFIALDYSGLQEGQEPSCPCVRPAAPAEP